MINKNKIVNRITFKRKTGYNLEFLSLYHLKQWNYLETLKVK